MNIESNRIRRRVIDDAKKLLKLDHLIVNLGGVKFVEFLIPGGRPFLALFKGAGDVPTRNERYLLNYITSIGYDVRWCTSYDGAMCTIKSRVRYARLIRCPDTGRIMSNKEAV